MATVLCSCCRHRLTKSLPLPPPAAGFFCFVSSARIALPALSSSDRPVACSLPVMADRSPKRQHCHAVTVWRVYRCISDRNSHGPGQIKHHEAPVSLRSDRAKSRLAEATTRLANGVSLNVGTKHASQVRMVTKFLILTGKIKALRS